MRELKFRAWYKPDIRKNKFIPFLTNMHAGNVVKFEWLEVKLRHPLTHDLGSVLWNDDWIVEQYTGLKDKNGIEIYEGDILDIWDSFVHNTYVVVFDISELDFKATNGKVCYGNSFSYLVCCDEIEVIGNIHENTDLINVIKGE